MSQKRTFTSFGMRKDDIKTKINSQHMKKRSDYRIVKFQWDFKRPDYFRYKVQQKYLWFFWVKPDIDNILSHWVRYSHENYTRANDFATIEQAEEAINQALEYQKRYKDTIVVG